MFNIANLAEIEWIIENGGIEYNPPTIHRIIQDCGRCKSKNFIASSTKRSYKKYDLTDRDTFVIYEEWKLQCADCGMKQILQIVTIVPPDEPHPRRELLKSAMYGE